MPLIELNTEARLTTRRLHANWPAGIFTELSYSSLFSIRAPSFKPFNCLTQRSSEVLKSDACLLDRNGRRFSCYLGTWSSEDGCCANC